MLRFTVLVTSCLAASTLASPSLKGRGSYNLRREPSLRGTEGDDRCSQQITSLRESCYRKRDAPSGFLYEPTAPSFLDEFYLERRLGKAPGYTTTQLHKRDKWKPTATEIAAKKVAGADNAAGRAENRKANAENQIKHMDSSAVDESAVMTGANAEALKLQYQNANIREQRQQTRILRAKQDAKENGQPMPKKPTRSEKQDMEKANMGLPIKIEPMTSHPKPGQQELDKPSTGADKTNNAGTTHTYSKVTDKFMAKQHDSQSRRADAQRVVAEALRHPNNPITKGQGPSAANSVLRSSVHDTDTTETRPGLDHNNDVKKIGKKRDQDVVTSIQAAPGAPVSDARHLPVVRNPTTSEAHYDPRQQEAYFPNNPNFAKNAAPAKKRDRGTPFYPRSLPEDLADELNHYLLVRALLYRRDLMEQLHHEFDLTD